MPDTIFDFTVRDARGTDYALQQHRGKVLLIVNVASRCGFTPQYDGLQALHAKYGPQGLVVLGFPCNQFGKQEPGSDDEIQSFCRMNYGVEFPVLAKIDVNGEHAAPVYQWLKARAPGLLGSQGIKWNFTKFLIGRDGTKVERFAPNDTPASLSEAIDRALQQPAAI